MKKLTFFFGLLVIALTSCDPGYNIDYRIINNSGHTVTFVSDSNYPFWKENPNGVTIKKGQDTVFYAYGYIGEADLSSAERDLEYYVYGDTVTYTFDDGKRLVYTQEEGNGPYDLEGDHYTWETKRGFVFLKCYDYYGCLTYTITEEDYNNSLEP